MSASGLWAYAMKQALKAIAGGLAFVLVLPCWFAFELSSLVLGRRHAFPGWSQAVTATFTPGSSNPPIRRK